MLNELLVSFEVYRAIQISMVVACVLCALLVVIVVLIQSSNSEGVSALNGRMTDTFYGKNKSKSVESKLKKLTVVCLVIMAVFMIAYFLVDKFLPVA